MEGRSRPHDPDYFSISDLLGGKRDLHRVVAVIDRVDFAHELVSILRLHERGIFLDEGFCDFSLLHPDGSRLDVARLAAQVLQQFGVKVPVVLLVYPLLVGVPLLLRIEAPKLGLVPVTMSVSKASAIA